MHGTHTLKKTLSNVSNKSTGRRAAAAAASSTAPPQIGALTRRASQNQQSGAVKKQTATEPNGPPFGYNEPPLNVDSLFAGSKRSTAKNPFLQGSLATAASKPQVQRQGNVMLNPKNSRVLKAVENAILPDLDDDDDIDEPLPMKNPSYFFEKRQPAPHTFLRSQSNIGTSFGQSMTKRPSAIAQNNKLQEIVTMNK